MRIARRLLLAAAIAGLGACEGMQDGDAVDAAVLAPVVYTEPALPPPIDDAAEPVVELAALPEPEPPAPPPR